MFKNLTIFTLPSDFKLDVQALPQVLQSHAFTALNAEQREAVGWVSPYGEEGMELAVISSGHVLITMAHQFKILPSSVVKQELNDRIKYLESTENRKVGTREKKALREQVEFELLGTAFTTTKYVSAWIDTYNHRLIVNTSSANQAEMLTSLLRKTVGTLPTAYWSMGNKTPVLMTQWIKECQAPEPFLLGDECELHAPGEQGAVAVFKKHELNTEEVMSNLNAGKVASKLMLTWADKVQFVLTDNLQFKKLKFLDWYSEQLNESEPTSKAEELVTEFTLMSGELNQMLNDLTTALA